MIELFNGKSRTHDRFKHEGFDALKYDREENGLFEDVLTGEGMEHEFCFQAGSVWMATCSDML